MQIRRIYIYKLAIVLLLILQTYFFDLIPGLNVALNNWNSDVSKKMELGIIMVLFLFSLGSELIRSHKTVDWKLIDWFCLFVLGTTVAIAYASSVRYNQSFVTSISGFYGLLVIPFGYWGLKPFFADKERVLWFYRTAIVFCAIYVFLQILQAVIFKLTGYIFLSYTNAGLVYIRDYGRFTEAVDFITFSSVLLCAKPVFLKQNWSRYEIALLLTILLYHVLLSKGRMYLLITLACLVLTLYFRFRSRFGRMLGSLAFLIGAFSLSYFVPLLIDRLSFTSGERAASYTIRTLGIQYYYNHIFYNHWYGIGFPDPTQYNGLLHGTIGIDLGAGLMNYVDLGLLGTVAILGIVGIVMVILLLISMLTALIKSSYKAPVLILCVYLIGEFFTLSPFDIQRTWIFSLTLLLLSFFQTIREGECTCQVQKLQ